MGISMDRYIDKAVDLYGSIDSWLGTLLDLKIAVCVGRWIG